MTKLLVCAAITILASHILCAQDTPKTSDRIFFDTSINKASDTAVKFGSDINKHDTSINNKSGDSSNKPSSDVSPQKKPGDIKLVVDKTDPAQVGTQKDWDTRWFISPLFKFQLQDFGMLEKNHFGYLSNANNLSILDRSNISASLSAYKNLSGRFSASADIGLAYGHVTSTDVLVATTTPKTYNLVNATVFYHLLGPQYKLQPFISVGINDLINDASYLSAPIGVGLKFHSRKIMVLAQAAYGYGVTKNIANTVMYNLCLYVPVNFKKKKPDNDDLAGKGNANGNKNDLAKNSKNDSTNKNANDTSASKNGLVNNINIIINMDSVMKARGGKDGTNGINGKSGKNEKNAKDDYDDDKLPNDDDGNNPNGSKKGLKAFNYDDFTVDDFEVDTIDGKPVVKFVVYFEFNQYDLNSSAFNRIDKVVSRLRKDKDLMVSIKGYTDNVGTNEFNLFLSKKRAQMVYDYMNSRGLGSDRMTARFYGKENPVADNSNPNTSWLNRRAEIFVYEKGTKVPNVILPAAKYLRK